MKNKNDQVIEAEVQTENKIVPVTPQSLDKPREDTEFAQASSKMLMDIVKQNNWARRLGGSQDHLQYEAWQTVGKYYSYTVKTHDAEYVEFGNASGFKAKATVVNEITGVEVGSAEAYCMNDENNWRSKPKFQLASMAQTRAGSKALRQILGFVVALAGYNPTPAEEMEGVHAVKSETIQHAATDTPNEPTYEPVVNGNGNGDTYIASEKQINYIKGLLKQTGKTDKQVFIKFDITDLSQLTTDQASSLIAYLVTLPVVEEKRTEEASKSQEAASVKPGEKKTEDVYPITVEQKTELMMILGKKGLSLLDLEKPLQFLKVKSYQDLNSKQAEALLIKIGKMPDAKGKKKEEVAYEQALIKQDNNSSENTISYPPVRL